MPLISTFYGILIYMYWLDTKQHHLPHIHAEYSGEEAVFSIGDGEILEGSIPNRPNGWCRLGLKSIGMN